MGKSMESWVVQMFFAIDMGKSMKILGKHLIMCFFSWRCLGMSSTIFLQFWLWCFFVRFVLGACYFSLACGKPPQKNYLKLPVVVRMNHETKTDIDHFQTHENYGSLGCLDPSVCLPLPHGKPTISFSIGDGCSPGQVDVFVFLLHWCF